MEEFNRKESMTAFCVLPSRCVANNLRQFRNFGFLGTTTRGTAPTKPPTQSRSGHNRHVIIQGGEVHADLRGPQETRSTLLEKIRSDPRHRNFTLLMEAPILKRSFGSWSMGFKKITQETVINFPGYHDSDDFSLMGSQFLRDPPKSLNLLLSFR